MASLQKESWTKALKIRHQGIRECLGEFMGTFILVIFATGAGMQSTLSRGSLSTFLSVNLAGGVGVMLAMFICGGVSGGCFNPAVSLAMSLTGRLPWKRLIFHFIGQIIGAFVSAALAYAVYKEALDKYDGGNRTIEGPNGTAGIFCSFPEDYLSAGAGLLDQIVGAGLLILSALMVIDKHNLAPPPYMCPLFVGLAVFAIGASYGKNCGYPINPAKDLGPRLFIMAAGWGTDVFSYRDYNWFWVPILGPLVGSVAACLFYWLFIELHWPEKAEISKMELDFPEPVMTTLKTNTEKTNFTFSINAPEQQGSVNDGFINDFCHRCSLQYTLGRGMFNSYLSVNIVSRLAVMMPTYMCGGLTVSPATKVNDWLDSSNEADCKPHKDQVVGGALLCISGLCILDKYNLNPYPGLTPIPIGLSVTAIGGSFGFNCGYPLNPAMDFGRRLFIYIAGWGSEVFSHRNYNWFWVPIVGPFLGASAATLIYWIFIDVHWPQKYARSDSLVEIQELPVSDHQNNGPLPKLERGTFQAHSNKKSAIYDGFSMNPSSSKADLPEGLFTTHL